MKKTRVLSLILILTLLSAFFVSCTGDRENTETTSTPESTPEDTTQQSGITTPAETEEDYRALKWNDTVSVFTWKEVVDSEFLFNSKSGDVFSEAVCKRLEDIRYYNEIEFKVTTKNGNWDNKSGFIKAVESNQSESGDKAYDIIGCYAPISGEMAVKGFLTNLCDSSLEYLKIGTGFWSEAYESAAIVNNAMYSLTGYITPTYVQNVSLVYVNLDMLKKYNGNVDIYDLVEKKQWTYEKLEELALGNSTATGDKTEYGLTMSGNVVYDDIFYSAGYKFVENFEDGAVGLTDLESDREFLDFSKYAYELLNSNPDVDFIAINAKANSATGTGAGFAYGNAMFSTGNFSQLKTSLADVSFNVGIIPMPIYKTSTNNDYGTIQSFWVTHYSIASNSDDKKLSAFALNRLQDYGMDLSDKYAELTLGQKFASSQNVDMLNLILEKLVFDTGRIYGTHIGMFSAFRQAAKTPEWIDYYTANNMNWIEAVKEMNRVIIG